MNKPAKSELPELVKTMLDPRTYPHKPERVEMAQTQMSFVFMAGDYVYKVKKPVNLGYLDYTTLEMRRFFCQKEVELNRRLCPEVYLDVVPITQGKYKISLGGRGEVIEYAVKMRYLPQERMLNVLLTSGEVSPEMLVSVAQKLAPFHEKAETSAAISAFGSLEAIRVNTEENFTQTEKNIGNTISQKTYRRIQDYTNGFVGENASLLRKRIARGRIRDCHGDLHAAHICFADGICIYDCIEFNDRFRYCDVASEVAFLAMDLDHYGRADLSRAFVNAYIDVRRDKGLKELLNFYKCYRAYVRGKVEGFKLDDPYISQAEKEKARTLSGSYFDLAASYTRSKPLLLITVGLVGTGKSVLSQALAKRLGLVVSTSDIVRKELAGIRPKEHRFEEFDSGIYATEFSRLTYDKMFSIARDVLSEGGSVILDASFIKAEERLKAKALAQETGADFFILECTLDEESVRKRLEERLKKGSVSDGRWEVYESQKKVFEPVVEVPPQNHVIIDTSVPVEEAVKYALERIEN